MAPDGAPRPSSRRGRELAKQRADAHEGRFNERIVPFIFPAIGAGQPNPATVKHSVRSLGGRFTRVLAMRGNLVYSTSNQLHGIEMANLRLRLQLNGQQDWVGGAPDNAVSFAMLFSGEIQAHQEEANDRWFWFASPPALRAGDVLTATITNTVNLGEGTPALTPELNLLVMDCDLYDALYDDEARV